MPGTALGAPYRPCCLPSWCRTFDTFISKVSRYTLNACASPRWRINAAETLGREARNEERAAKAARRQAKGNEALLRH